MEDIKAFGFDQGAARDIGLLFIPEKSKTLVNGTCAGHHNAVLVNRGGYWTIDEKMGQTYTHHECANTLAQRDYKQPQAVVYEEEKMRTVVRRLTPLECERLQGFPDGWTDIGEWIDTKGKLHKESSDSSRYKALGNSIALPFWKWLAKRICAQYERDVTMGSLFDGIGGFPLAFEKAGAKAVWASEIEEFPIAVTKRHFPEEVHNEQIH